MLTWGQLTLLCLPKPICRLHQIPMDAEPNIYDDDDDDVDDMVQLQEVRLIKCL